MSRSANKSLFQRSRPHKPKTKVPLPRGTCFIMPDLPYPNGTKPEGGKSNNHPFIVLNTDSTRVLVVMAQTMGCSAEDKYRCDKVDSNPYSIELTEPHPPMQSPHLRTQYVDLRNAMIIPKKVLFDSPNFRICHDGAENVPTPTLNGMIYNVWDPDQKINRDMTQTEDLLIAYRAAYKSGKVRILRPYGKYEKNDPLMDVSKYPTDPIYEERRNRHNNAAKNISQNTKSKSTDKQFGE